MASKFVLLKDGKVVMRGTETEVWQYLHRHESGSVSYCVTYAGYAIKPQCGYYGCDNPAEPGEVCHECAGTRKEEPDCAEAQGHREG